MGVPVPAVILKKGEVSMRRCADVRGLVTTNPPTLSSLAALAILNAYTPQPPPDLKLCTVPAVMLGLPTANGAL